MEGLVSVLMGYRRVTVPADTEEPAVILVGPNGLFHFQFTL